MPTARIVINYPSPGAPLHVSQFDESYPYPRSGELMIASQIYADFVKLSRAINKNTKQCFPDERRIAHNLMIKEMDWTMGSDSSVQIQVNYPA
jgi:hypothetical protein